jgi:hypothetical protein
MQNVVLRNLCIECNIHLLNARYDLPGWPPGIERQWQQCLSGGGSNALAAVPEPPLEHSILLSCIKCILIVWVTILCHRYQVLSCATATPNGHNIHNNADTACDVVDTIRRCQRVTAQVTAQVQP